MTASTSPVFRHARDRHRSDTLIDSATAVLSRLLEPEVAAVWWISGHPEAVILPMIAGILTLAGLVVLAMVFAAGGVAVVVVVVCREADWRRELREDVEARLDAEAA